MVARIELIEVVRYQVYCEEEHKTLAVINTEREAIRIKDAHNTKCQLVGITKDTEDHTQDDWRIEAIQARDADQ